MSSGMNRLQAEDYAKTMTYREAIRNTVYAKGVDYKKATRIKLQELAEIADKLVLCKDCEYADFESPYPVCNLIEMNITDDDYCSWGEREEE